MTILIATILLYIHSGILMVRPFDKVMNQRLLKMRKSSKPYLDKGLNEFFELLGIIFKNVPYFLISRGFGPYFMHCFNCLKA